MPSLRLRHPLLVSGGGQCPLTGVPPVAKRTIIFYDLLLPLQSPVTLPGGNRGSAPKPPLPKGGGLA